MKYNQKERKLIFIKVPILLRFYGENEIESINALNEILDIIFHYSKSVFYTIDFVNKDAGEKKIFKKENVIFENYEDFFNYFAISKRYEQILIKLIPIKYFTTFDDSNFEKKIPNLLSKFFK